MEPIVKAYIREAIEREKAGLKVKLKETADFKIRDEFSKETGRSPRLESYFSCIDPGTAKTIRLSLFLTETTGAFDRSMQHHLM
jgi:uncharacterized protein YdeI (YjbR/CyaY-like superfamily)